MPACIKCGGTNGHSPMCGMTKSTNNFLVNTQTCPICSQPIRSQGHHCKK